jgi:hypothetical protein
MDPLLGKDLETNEKEPLLCNGAVNARTTIELLLETVFSTRSFQKGYKEDNWDDPVS